MKVSSSTLPRLKQNKLLPFLSQVAYRNKIHPFLAALHLDRFLNIKGWTTINNCSRWNPPNLSLSVSSMPLPTLPMGTIFCIKLRVVMEITKIVGVPIDYQLYFATIPTITTIGASSGDKFFLTKTYRSVPTISGATVNTDMVNK
jgi:hypothetical protein